MANLIKKKKSQIAAILVIWTVIDTEGGAPEEMK